MAVHPGLLKMINKMISDATSSENEGDYINPRLKNDILEQIKENKLFDMYYPKLLDKMQAKDAKVRNLTFQLIGPMIMQNRSLLERFIRDLYIFVDCIFGTQNDIPEPELSMKDLRIRFKEHIEILANKLGKQYPHLLICKEYIRDKLNFERRTQKRMQTESNQYQPPPTKKRHSMEILQEAVNKTITELFDIMDVFEYEDLFDVQFDSFNVSSANQSDTFAGEDDFFSDLFVNPEEVKKKQTEQSAQTKERIRLYKKMNECYLNLVNEYLILI